MRRFICGIVSFAMVLGCCSMVRAGSAPRSALAALALRMPEVKFEDTRLADAIDHLRDASDANFHVDWKALESVGVTRDTPVSITARGITLRKTLSLILAQTGNPGDLSFYNDGGVIEVTTKAIADNILVTRVYDVVDLLILPLSMNSNNNGTNGTTSGNGINSGSSSSGRNGYGNTGRSGSSRGRSGGGGMTSRSGGGSLFGSGGGGSYSGRSSSYSNTSGTTGNGLGTDTQAMADQLVTLIMDTIEPNIWRENGGTATIRYFRGNLIITAPRRIHERIGGAFE